MTACESHERLMYVDWDSKIQPQLDADFNEDLLVCGQDIVGARVSGAMASMMPRLAQLWWTSHGEFQKIDCS